MTKTLVNFRSTHEELERWKAALEKENRTISDVCRKALDRFTSRVENSNGTDT